MRLPLLVVALMAPTIFFAAPATAKDKKPEDPNKRVCRSDIPTGSIMPERECHTAAEWKLIDDRNARAAHDTLSHGNPGTQR